MCAAVSLLFIPTAFETSGRGSIVYFLYADVCKGFYVAFMGGTVFSHVYKCRCDVSSAVLYVCAYVCELALPS